MIGSPTLASLALSVLLSAPRPHPNELQARVMQRVNTGGEYMEPIGLGDLVIRHDDPLSAQMRAIYQALKATS